ncbi:hypothetical protein DV515_00014197, partial [Chloebia gouldiae]
MENTRIWQEQRQALPTHGCSCPSQPSGIRFLTDKACVRPESTAPTLLPEDLPLKVTSRRPPGAARPPSSRAMAGTASPRPLRGQSFYLDLPSGRSARDLAEAIGRLGGVTESFLSKEVTYVVSSNREAKRGQARAREEKQNSPAAEGTKSTSSVPAAPKGTPARPRQKLPSPALLSRGKELLNKAMKNQDSCSGSSILANARLWGVQILHVDEMLSYAQQLLRAISGAGKQCQKTEAKCPASRSKIHKGKLKPPFLKVEDQSRKFRPFHHQFQSFPDLNFLAPKSSSPFEPLKNLSNSCQARGAEGCALHSAGGKSPRSTHVTVPRKRRGFCECCQETFEELQKHLQSPQHQRFAQDSSQYIPVDRVISQLTNSFVEWSAKVPWSCLADECVMPQAHSTGGIKLLPAELGKEGEQPEQGTVELGTERAQSPGLLPPAPQSPGAAHGFSRSSSGSDWDVQLLPSLSGVQGCRIPAVDRDLLQQRHVSVRDSRSRSWPGQAERTRTAGAAAQRPEEPLSPYLGHCLAAKTTSRLLSRASVGAEKGLGWDLPSHLLCQDQEAHPG